MTFNGWWASLGKEGLERRAPEEHFRVIAHMAFVAGQRHADGERRIDGQTIEQWRDRALITERNLADALDARSDGDIENGR